MSTKLAKSIVILLLALAVTAPAAGAATKAQGLLREINRTRVAHDLRPLRLDSRLTRFAHRHSQEMARTRVLAHTAPLLLPAPHALAVGENLAWIPGDRPADVVAAWMASPAHRANLLSPRYSSVGLGDVAGLVTADFAG
jgi:uncharacterized protein YkwD